MATAATASAPASASTSGRDPLAAAASSPAAVCLVPFRWWARVREEEEAGGVQYAATAAASPSYYGLRLLHSFLHPDLVLRLELGECRAGGAGGRSYALVPADELSRALARQNSGLALQNKHSFAGDSAGAYPLVLRISVQETSILTLKISKKDNPVENYKRANKIFNADSQPVHVWDFSGQTNLILMNEWNRLHHDCCHADQENLLEVQVYAMSDSLTSKIGGSNKENSGEVYDMNAHLSDGSFGRAGSMGLIGLENLGNTCFMNSSIQCLAHTPKLVDYFLGDYARDINRTNPLGLNGELALAFGELLRSLWTTDRKPVAPHHFKTKIACFAPQFSGFNQHDSQELLAFLLDGLHEDLNQVKCKPYEEAKDASGRPDEEVADEYWSNHLARNDSVIVDICHGQYRSTLTCPTCSKTSVTFDPFMYLSLPVPSTAKRAMTVTVFSTDGSREPFPYDVIVPKFCTLSDLVQALSIACSLGDDEILLVTEVYNNCIIQYLEEPSDSVSLLRDGDKLAAYRLPKKYEKSPLVVFTHQHSDEHSSVDDVTPQMKEFEAPLLAALPEMVNGSSLRSIYLKLLNPFLISKGTSSLNDCARSNGDSVDLMDATLSGSDSDFQNAQLEDDPESSHFSASECEIMKGPIELYNGGTADSNKDAHMEEFEFYLKYERGDGQQQKIEINELDLLNTKPSRLHVNVHWQHNALRQYDTSMLSNLPEIHKLELIPKGTEDSVALHGCLEAFLKEEPLGPEDMWYCPCCKKHQQAMKKLDLWRLPEVLVIHLKRFSYTQVTRNKLETFVDFPISDLDLSSYIANKSEQPSSHYRLYAICNHYGNMGGGHYTASIYHEEGKGWYKFDDDCVTPISEDSIKTPAAYVLFYRRE
ncbi:ubiquitin carboxyl-terminal hydrolase 8-like [Phragmites australis]|uniref:ubiquitin carboxyl-terminal hydrolase 8-like n=1 Tax=Phragmites australis TaxID=29695 RepID=UPI002D7A17CD|nr:ubiquitin carboxyl-terminal hydrolase 8-like [Phragmites australis]